MFRSFLHHSVIIFQSIFDINFGIDLCTDFKRLGIQNGSPNPPFRHLGRLRKRFVVSPPSPRNLCIDLWTSIFRHRFLHWFLLNSGQFVASCWVNRNSWGGLAGSIHSRSYAFQCSVPARACVVLDVLCAATHVLCGDRTCALETIHRLSGD